MDQFFTFLYPAVALISSTAYFPQIKSLIYAKTACHSISIKSWVLWIVSGLIALGYASFSVGDALLVAATMFNVVLCTVVLGLVIHNRYVRFGDSQDVVQAGIQAMAAVIFPRKQSALEPIKITVPEQPIDKI